MKDILGRDIQCGDNIIVTVSRKSHYLTSATVESLEEDGGVSVRYSSTVATKKIKPDDIALVYEPKPYILDGRLGLCRDCTNQVIKAGDRVLYRIPGGVDFGVVSEVLDSLWVILENGEKVRNVGIFVL